MRCESTSRVVSLAHVEVFAAGHVVQVPAGIGFAPPLVRDGAYVSAGECVYPMRTLEPTGLVLLGAGTTRTVGQFFDLWGQPLTRRRVAAFSAGAGQGVSVFINGVPWRESPDAAPVSPGTQITIEVGRYVPPHTIYTFPSPASVARAR